MKNDPKTAHLQFPSPKTSGPCKGCGEAHSARLDTKRGELTCTNCGLVRRSSLRVERIRYRTAEYAGRVRSSKTTDRTFLARHATVTSRGAKGHRERLRGRQVAKDLGQQHIWAMERWSRLDKQIEKSGGIVEDICADLRLPENTTRMAKRFVHDYLKNPHSIKKTKIVASVAVFITCRTRNMARSLKEFGECEHAITKKELGKYFKIASKEMRLPTRPPHLLALLPSMGLKCAASRSTMVTARKMARWLDDTPPEVLIGRSPESLVAAILVLARRLCGLGLDLGAKTGKGPPPNLTLESIALKLKIAENTILKCLKDLVYKTNLKQLFPIEKWLTNTENI